MKQPAEQNVYTDLAITPHFPLPMDIKSIEMFSDGVIAIILTLMAVGLNRPTAYELSALQPLLPFLLSYVLSYAVICVCWNSHHQLFHLVMKMDRKSLWANLHLLFWLSLLPFATDWMGEGRFARWPTVLYGFVSLMIGLAFMLLHKSLIQLHGSFSDTGWIMREVRMEWLSIVLYMLGMGLCFVHPWLGFGLYAVVAAAWVIPRPLLRAPHSGG